MPRPVSTAALQAMFAADTPEAFLVLLTISNPAIAPSIRVVNNMENLVSRGSTFLAYPFDITLPLDRDDELGRVMLKIDNVDQRIVQAVRSVVEPITVRLEVVLASSPDTIEAGPFDFTLRNVEYDALLVEGTLMFEDVLNEPFPQHTFVPVNHPGLFA